MILWKALMSIMLVCSIILMIPATVVEAKTQYMGYYYAAKGQPMIFQEAEKGTIKILKDGGNKCIVTKNNKLKVTCKKSGEICYKINGKKKSFDIYVGGNGKDTAVNEKEYDIPKDKYDGKKYYKNFIEVARAMKKNKGWNYCTVRFLGEEDMKGMEKYNRGLGYHNGLSVLDAYPSWEDIGYYTIDGEEHDCCYAARYYDKTSGWVFVKGFVYDNDWEIRGVVYIGYDPKDKSEVITLKQFL